MSKDAHFLVTTDACNKAGVTAGVAELAVVSQVSKIW
jgi:hypothetical protein